MLNPLQRICGKERNILIGAVHLPPSPGYPDAPGNEVAVRNALLDAAALENGGADSIIFENNYDVPHTEEVGEGTKEALRAVGEALIGGCRLPLGISVLWNDYRTALDLAKELGLSFVRIPVFVDKVRTEYGVFEGKPEEITSYRDSIGAHNVALFVDIHVKHAELLVDETLVETAQKAIAAGADAVIITGQWTGNAPNLDELRELRAGIDTFPILCGSGVDEENIQKLFTYANGAIVSTSLKEASSEAHTQNLKPYESRLVEEKVRRIVNVMQ